MDSPAVIRNPTKLHILHNDDFLTTKDVLTSLEYNDDIKDIFVRVVCGDGIVHRLRICSAQKAADNSYIELVTSLLV